MAEGDQAGLGTPWYRRRMFWVWGRLFGGAIGGGVVSLILAIGLKSWPMVGYGVGLIVVGCAFAALVARLTRDT